MPPGSQRTTLVRNAGISKGLRPEGVGFASNAGRSRITVIETAPPPGMTPTCETAGVLGPAVAVIASFEAVEAELSEIREKGRERALEAQSLRAAVPDSALPALTNRV